LRGEGDMTLQQLADAVGSSKSYIWELERGTSNPTLPLAYAIAKVLCATVYEVWPDTTEIVEEFIRVRRVVSRPTQQTT